VRQSQLTVGRTYLAKVSGRLTVVRLDEARVVRRYVTRSSLEKTVFDVTNLRTGRKLTFKSARRFLTPEKAP
jgi:hypothetical protein